MPYWIGEILLRTLVVVFCFGLVASCHFLIPGVNEPHYVGMARHFWEPEWCARDQFLSSYPTHTVFYATWGWLVALAGSFWATCIGRAVCWILLSYSLGALFVDRDAGTGPENSDSKVLGYQWGIGIFLVLHEWHNLSGEWLIGGFESKIFAYAFSFWGIRSWEQKKPGLSAAWFGLAVSAHPVVGMWIGICLAGAILPWNWPNSPLHRGTYNNTSVAKGEPRSGKGSSVFHSLGSIGNALGVAFLCSLPGLIPLMGLMLNPEAAPGLDQAGTIREANLIQVHRRLGHHLDPLAFHLQAIVIHSVLTGLWLLLCWRERKWSLFDGMTLVSVLIALIGFVIGGLANRGEVPFWTSFLKFYFFRVADVFVPLAFSMKLGTWGATRIPANQSLIKWGVFSLLIGLALWGGTRAKRPLGPYEQDWIKLCQWIQANTDQNALFVTTKSSFAFKWFAERAEYVSYKDCPQDPLGIVVWDRRLKEVAAWRERSQDSISKEELEELAEMTDAEYYITQDKAEVALKPEYQAGRYRLFRLPRPIGNSGLR